MGIQDYLGKRVEKGALTNLDTGESKSFLYNPAELQESYGARYAFMDVPGLSHQPAHFVGNKNTRIPLTLIFDQLVYDVQKTSGQRAQKDPTQPSEVMQWRNFLLSLTMARRSQRLAAASPPPVLFYWPGMFLMRMRIEDLDFQHVMFETGTPKPRMFLAKVSLFEDPQGRIYSEDMGRLGTFRSWAAHELNDPNWRA